MGPVVGVLDMGCPNVYALKTGNRLNAVSIIAVNADVIRGKEGKSPHTLNTIYIYILSAHAKERLLYHLKVAIKNGQ